MRTHFCLWSLMLACCLGPLSLLAQTKGTAGSDPTDRKAAKQRETRRYGVSQFGLAYGRVYDERMSRRSYRGPGAQLAFGVMQKRPQELESLVVAFRGFYLTANSGSQIWGAGGEIDYQYLRKLNWTRSPAWRWYLGGAAQGFINGRYHPSLGNSSFHMEWVGALALAGRSEIDLTLPLIKRCTLGASLTLPLISYVGRLPVYALPGFESPSHALALLGNFTRVRTAIDLTRSLAQGNLNRIRISYHWDFYAYRDNSVHRLRYAVHGLTVTTLLRQGKVYSSEPAGDQP